MTIYTIKENTKNIKSKKRFYNDEYLNELINILVNIIIHPIIQDFQNFF
jgi:hypothetical protein